MANVIRNSSGLFSIRFRFGPHRFNRSLETNSEKEAKEAKARIQKTIRRIKEGEIDLPKDLTPDRLWDFLRSGGRGSDPVKLAAPISLEKLAEEYFAKMPDGAKEATSLKTERTHVKNLTKHLRASTPLYELNVERLQAYVSRRQKDAGHHGKPVQPDTIRKELQTFRQLWAFATSRKYVIGAFPLHEITFPKADMKQPFRTWDEIEAATKRGGYDEQEQKELWDRLFLRDEEIDELLGYVRGAAAHSFIYPMFAFAAYTGARRSEIIRSEVNDFHLEEGYVLIREKKRCRNARTSYRDIVLHPRLKEIITDWFEHHSGGRYTIAVPPGLFHSKESDLPQPLTASQANNCFGRTLANSRWKVVRGFHVLRHSFASNLARKGVHQSIIDRWLGHQTAEMRDRYRHLFPDEKQRAMEAMAMAAYPGGKPSS